MDPQDFFSGFKTKVDYDRAQQEFNARQSLANQQIQSGAIDAQSKKNVFATQVLSAAAASGDQASYDKGKAYLQQNGIDVSNWAPDVQTGAQQAQAARLAQSPLGSLLNTATKMDSNNLTAAGLSGQLPNDPNGIVTSVLRGAGLAQPTPQASLGDNSPASIAAQIKPMINGQLPANLPTNVPQAPAPMPGMVAPEVVSAVQNAGRFSPPKQNPGETVAAYKNRVDTAFNAFKEDPNTIAAQEQAKAKATTLGKDQGDATKEAVGSQEGYNQVVQNLEAIKNLAPNVPQERYGIPASAKTWFSQNFGDQTTANNAKTFGTINESQGINAIKALAATGQLRMNQRMEAMINRGYLVDPNASPQEKINQANAIEAELKNAMINAQNVNANLNGGQTQDYSSPLVNPSAPPGGKLIGTSNGKAVYQLPDGSHVMEQ